MLRAKPLWQIGAPACLLLLVAIIVVLPQRIHYTATWGPAKFSIRLKDASTERLLGVRDCAIAIEGMPSDAFEVTRSEDQIDVTFRRMQYCGHRFVWGWDSGRRRFAIRVHKPGYVARTLRYPGDFQIMNYNSRERIDWRPAIEFHGRTLYLHPHEERQE